MDSEKTKKEWPRLTELMQVGGAEQLLCKMSGTCVTEPVREEITMHLKSHLQYTAAESQSVYLKVYPKKITSNLIKLTPNCTE